MRDEPLDDAGWGRETVAGIPIRVLLAGPETIGGVVILTDFDWPAAAGLVSLRERLQAARLAAVLPDVRSWWIDRPEARFPASRTPLTFVAEELVPWIAGHSPAGLRLATLGVGIGGQGAFQLAYRFPQVFPVAAAVSPAFDFQRLYSSAPQLQAWFESEERARQETATLRLHPLNWPPHQWFTCPRGDWRFDGCERLASKLGSSGIPYTADFDVTDDLSVQVACAIDFIAARLSEPLTTREIRFAR